ncbi:hypothetical protein N7495_009510 [Penicillium taxi]|uniref:uncharacterized protein n=1 Tax=Penicillium taxi TaxID=168475 RepID=UPI002545402A|nr:uncharacterized protein N7495_009510 [Penicillium taxi]KAJ5885000.1 hypothetical protein N7495_009510 [Penicillium taxi]
MEPGDKEDLSKAPEGLVLPPKDIRVIVEKTAGYVARNGIIFEERIRDKEKSNPKFSFLIDNDPYAPFYQWRVAEIRGGRGTAVSAGRAGEAAPAVEAEKPTGPIEPPPFHFSARMPNINAKDFEVVKLVALWTAQRGKSWLNALALKESRNSQFDFLRPQHSLYQFFTRLIDQYTIVIRPEGIDDATTEQKRIAELKENVKNKWHILERAKQRSEWTKHQIAQKEKKDEQAEQERIEYAQIDWHDFVLVETVTFTAADDAGELPPPTSLNDLQCASLEQKAALSLNLFRIEEAMPTDLDNPTYYNATESAPVTQPPAPVSYPAQPAAMDYNVPYPNAPQAAVQVHTESPVAAIPGQPAIRIRTDYVPQGRRPQAPLTAPCPNCKQQILISEMEQHMRIELLDPRWRREQDKLLAETHTTNLSTVDAVNNLKRLASQRTDLFNESPLTLPPDTEEEARRKRVTGTNPSGWVAPSRK